MRFTYNGQDLDIEDGFVYLGASFPLMVFLLKTTADLQNRQEKLCFLY